MKNLAGRLALILTLASAGLSNLSGCKSGVNAGDRPLHAMRQDGDVRYDVGNYSEAATHYQQYVDAKPNDADIHYKLGRCYVEMGDYRRAKQHLQVAYDLAPDNEDYIDALADDMARAGENEQLSAFLIKVVNERGRASDYLRLGQYSMKIGTVDDAAAALLTAAKLDGGVNARYQFALARFYQHVGDQTHEVERLRMAYFLAPNNQEVRERARALGEIVGPTWALRPVEQEMGVSPTDTGQPAGTAK